MNSVKKTGISSCLDKEVEIVPVEILDEFNISYEEANKTADKMVLLAKALKKYYSRAYCSVPFCHTAEAEVFGAEVFFDRMTGNRVGKYKIDHFNDLENVLDILNTDSKTERISEIVKAIKLLKKDGEDIILNVTAPISIATLIMDSRNFYFIHFNISDYLLTYKKSEYILIDSTMNSYNLLHGNSRKGVKV